METLESKIGKPDWKQWLPVYGLYQVMRDNLKGKPSINDMVDKNIALLASADEDEGPVDPHYWLSVKNAILIATQIKDELTSLYPQYSETFNKNYDSYVSELTSLDQEITSRIAALKSPSFATFHSAWTYFANDYDVNIVTTFEEFPGKEPTAEYLKEFSDTIKNSNVKVIFAEPQFSTTQLTPIAEDLGIKIATLDPEGGGVEGVDSYIELMRYNVSAMESSLSQ